MKIGFAEKSGNKKTLITKRVLKNNIHSYIKFASENYYLSVDSLPFMSNDVCNELQKIKLDTTLIYGEPLSMSVSVVLIINKNGKIETYGIARGVNSSYYEDATLKVLQKHIITGICKPAKVGNDTVNSFLRLSFNFGQGTCKISTNSPPFFYSAKQ